ncbi:MAG: hypothetical protein JSW37_09275 [Anaerolineales bacterium]|nr:MAG: hypothetical protein JSW37_09275 [Anaerolineales bacterium]
MKTQALRSLRRSMLAMLVLLCIASPLMTACGPAAATPAPSPTAAPTAAPIPGTTVALATGGSVFVPEGALPAGATINAAVTRMPPLPDDVKPVGEAWSITASAQPLLPLTLRLPVPAGVSDPEKLAILHIEADGTTTFLVTRVEDDELVAETLGLSTYVRVERLRRSRQLFGAERLLVGETSTYFLWIPDPTTNVSTEWDCSGPADVIASSDWQATVQAGPSPGGLVWLHYSVLEQPQGDSLVHRWEGFRLIPVDDNPQRFRVVAAAAPSVAHIGQETVNVVATVHGDYQAPISWIWRFEGGGGGGEAETGAGTTRFELPAGTYPAQDQPGIYRVRIWAEDAQHRLSESWAGYELVGAEPLLVELEGPWRLSWSGPPGVYEEYTAVASGGKPPYKFSFLLFPGAKAQEGAGGLPKTTLQFDQPGEHRLDVACTDAAGNTAKASLPITVQGGEPLSTRMVELPATAQPQQEVTARIQIRGGVLVTSGQKSGYRLEVDWGEEGSAKVIEQNVGAQVTPYEGTVVLQFHTYNEANTYTVRVEAFDAAGNMDWYEQDIVISAAPTPAQQPTAHLPAPSPVQQPTIGSAQLVWVRQPDPVVNVNNDPLRYEETEARWAGTFSAMTASETQFTTEERYVEHEVEWYDLTITVSFDTPPPVLNPGQSYSMEANFTHGGNQAQDGEGLGEQFWYAAQRGFEAIIEPREVLRYGPLNPNFDGTSTKQWTLTAPPATQEGDTFDLYAGLWNRPPCNVTWTYRAEYQ